MVLAVSIFSLVSCGGSSGDGDGDGGGGGGIAITTQPLAKVAVIAALQVGVDAMEVASNEGEPFTITGAEGGSCTATKTGTEEARTYTISCTDFADGEFSLDGTDYAAASNGSLVIVFAGDEAAGTIGITTTSFTVEINGTLYTATISVDVPYEDQSFATVTGTVDSVTLNAVVTCDAELTTCTSS